MSKVKEFELLHQQEKPLLIGNVWNVQSAKIFEKMGFQAIGTSSAAIADSLGYEDGEKIPFEEYFFIIERIAGSVKTPLTVDLEAGYGKDAETVFKHIKKLSELGVVGVNLEDSVVKNSVRSLVDQDLFSEKLVDLNKLLQSENIEMFINVRCDVFLLDAEDQLNQAKERIVSYQKSGVDGIFLPCICSENDIIDIIATTDLPLNVMTIPDLPDYNKLTEMGVKRVSTGNFLYNYSYNKLEEKVQELVQSQHFKSIF